MSINDGDDYKFCCERPASAKRIDGLRRRLRPTGLTSLKVTAPVKLLTTFPRDERTLRSTEISLWFASNDRSTKIPSGFKYVSLHEWPNQVLGRSQHGACGV